MGKVVRGGWLAGKGCGGAFKDGKDSAAALRFAGESSIDPPPRNWPQSLDHNHFELRRDSPKVDGIAGNNGLPRSLRANGDMRIDHV